MKLSNLKWNFLGLVAPLVIAAVAIPVLIEKLGQERFGVLALCWALIGYSSVIDFGVGRAVTQKISKYRGESNYSEIPLLIAQAVNITCSIGFFAFVVIASFALFDINKLINISSVSAIDLKIAVVLMAVTMPAQALSATYRGVNEAYLNFKEVSLVRVSLGAINFGGPLIIANFSSSISALVLSLTVSRIIACYIYRVLSKRCIKHVELSSSNPEVLKARDLLSYGGWVTVSAVVNPFFAQAGKFYLSTIVAASAVTIFSIPYEVTIQILVLATVVSSVAFPTISQMISSNGDKVFHHFEKWLKLLSLFLLLVCSIWFFTSPLILELWLGDNYSSQFDVVARIVVIGVFFNGVGTLLYAYIHAVGLPKWTAISHVVQLVLYLSALYPAVVSYEEVGAAAVWATRVCVDFLVLLSMYYFVKHKSNK